MPQAHENRLQRCHLLWALLRFHTYYAVNAQYGTEQLSVNIIFSIAYSQSPCPMLIVKKYTFSAPAAFSILAALWIVFPVV